MSTIDEVLATAEVVDAVCVIDGETRVISVPTEYKELGVESDEKVTRVKFQCPKIVGDNIDLTEYNLYINYRNAGNKLNSYLVEDVTVTGDTINFSWLLSRHVTESPGTISYIVCAKKSDDTGVINEWNTKVATGIVGIGLEATEEIEEQNIDVIEQILRSIVELENKVSGGLTTEKIKALDGMFKVCAFTKADVSAEYTAFKTAFGITDEPVTPEVTLTSISAVYDGGDVAVGTAVTALTGITVTATYSDGSTAVVTGYTLSGTIAEGSNTITVSYGGMTTTFTVTGVAESGGDTENVSNETKWTNGVAYTYTTVKDEYLETNGTLAKYNGWDRTPYLYCAGASRLRVVVENPTGSIRSSSQYNGFFDENKNFISQFKYNTIDQDTVGAYVDVSVPADAVYFIASGVKTVITDYLSKGPAVSFTPYE